MNVRRAFYVTKSPVNAIRSRLRESQHGSIAIFFGFCDDLFQSRKVRHVPGRGEEIEMFLVHLMMPRIEFSEREWLGGHRGNFMRKNHGFRLNL